METVKIFTAGVAVRMVNMTIDRLKAEEPGLSCEVRVGGSASGINALLGGERFDVMVLADSSCIDEQLMQAYAEGYRIWGGNEMVVMGDGINAENWKEVLLAPDSEIRHANPYNDPGGYRAVMAMTLADKVEPGLSDKLLKHQNYRGLDRAQYGKGFMPLENNNGHKVYKIVYKSLAISRNENFAPLPRVMNLGDPGLEEIYKTASFPVDGGHVARGGAILHAVMIPKKAENPFGGEKFVRLFLANRFDIHGFTPVERSVGKWTIRPVNM